MLFQRYAWIGLVHFSFLSKCTLFNQNNRYFTINWTNTRYVCTYLNQFLTVIPERIMKFHKFEEKKKNVHSPATYTLYLLYPFWLF